MSTKEENKAPDADAEQRILALRTVIFGTAVAVLVALSGYFVLDVITQSSGVDLSASEKYTVEMLRMPENHRETLERIARSDEIKQLLEVEELFTVYAGEGEFALCAGRFRSPEADGAKGLLSRVKNFQRGSQRPFEDAQISPVGAVQ